MELMIIEDSYYKNLLPLTWLRPVYELRCGILTLREKILKAYDRQTCTLGCRGYLEDYQREKAPGFMVNEAGADSMLVVNGRVLWNRDMATKIPLSGPDRLYCEDGQLVAARLSGENLRAVNWKTPAGLESFPDIEREEVEAALIRWPWDLVHHNAQQIDEDFQALALRGTSRGHVDEGVHMLGRHNIAIAAGARVYPGVVLDAEEGPILIDENARVQPNATIIGPAAVGSYSIVRTGAKIYEGTTIGENCKVGGEVEESILHSYTNKQHEGFLGHAYAGQWVNLGADTNNSDLKNDYGNVRCTINGKPVDTGSIFAGAFIADHSKTGINTMLNTGTVIGIGCNLFGAGLPPKSVPSFCWGGGEGLVEYRLDKFLDVARKVMARRNQQLSATEETLLRKVFKLTADERRAAIRG
jgi:UDP-N-acetylglucosamine diphosphorylase/glucosamine-1-phosphate N-acetyltransferase